MAFLVAALYAQNLAISDKRPASCPYDWRTSVHCNMALCWLAGRSIGIGLDLDHCSERCRILHETSNTLGFLLLLANPCRMAHCSDVAISQLSSRVLFARCRNRNKVVSTGFVCGNRFRGQSFLYIEDLVKARVTYGICDMAIVFSRSR
jgi:hypothetical protein